MSAVRIEETAAFPFIEASGSPRNVGLQYGRKAAERIRRTIDIYQRSFAEKGVDWTVARTAAAPYALRIERAYPRIAEEMRGIATGAGVPFEDIVAINARTDILHGSLGKARDGSDDIDGCTSAVALPPTTREGHLIHAQNWDWRDECADCSIVLKIVPDTGPSMLLFAEAGLVAYVGLNNAGLAITTNHLESEQARGDAQSHRQASGVDSGVARACHRDRAEGGARVLHQLHHFASRRRSDRSRDDPGPGVLACAGGRSPRARESLRLPGGTCGGP
jgi:hypothetical protein